MFCAEHFAIRANQADWVAKKRQRSAVGVWGKSSRRITMKMFCAEHFFAGTTASIGRRPKTKKILADC
jgi:hypothetical protein